MVLPTFFDGFVQETLEKTQERIRIPNFTLLLRRILRNVEAREGLIENKRNR
jgi:hypothetical protein